MKKIALYLMLITIISKVLGFGREIVLAYYYGASNVSDAYLISQTIPGTMFEFIGLAITTTFIPIYIKIINDEGQKKADKYTSNLLNVLFILSFFIIVFVMIFSKPIVTVFASGFDDNTLNLASTFTQISIIGIFFMSMNYVLSSYLQTKESFLSVSLAGIPFNFIVVLSIVISFQYNYLYLPLGSVVAAFAQFIVLYYFSLKKNYVHRLKFNFRDKNIKKMLILSLPVTLGVSVNQINKLVDRTLASRISIGGISGLNYANRLNSFIQGIFVMSIIAVIYPRLSKLIVNSEMKAFKRSLTSVIGSICVVIVPIMVGTLLFSEEIIGLLFGRGAFEGEDIKMTSEILFYYSLSMLGVGIREILSKAFYAMNDTKTPMINAAIGVVINIVLNIILSHFLGIGGLALATSISANIIPVLLYIKLRKKIGSIEIRQLGISFLKVLLASLIMGLLCSLSFNYLIEFLNSNMSLFITIGMGVVIYFILISIMKIEEMNVIIKSLKKKIVR